MEYWYTADNKDLIDEEIGDIPQLYGLDAIAYESIMLGAFGIFYGPSNQVCKELGRPKKTDIQIGYSRDGFNWIRPDRNAFISGTYVEGDWNYGYLHSDGGICTVVDDELHFYFSVFSGESPRYGRHMYAGGSTGMAILRRDGFVSMGNVEEECVGVLVTNNLQFEGEYLFVNFIGKELGVEILDEKGKTISGYEIEQCNLVSGDSTKCRITWSEKSKVPTPKQIIKLKFVLKNAELYSFWISKYESGESEGYLAAGGPNAKNGRDTK